MLTKRAADFLLNLLRELNRNYYDELWRGIKNGFKFVKKNIIKQNTGEKNNWLINKVLQRLVPKMSTLQARFPGSFCIIVRGWAIVRCARWNEVVQA